MISENNKWNIDETNDWKANQKMVLEQNDVASIGNAASALLWTNRQSLWWEESDWGMMHQPNT